MTATIAPLSLYLPLWGAHFDDDDAGLVGGQVLSCIPDAEEWDEIQQREVANERRRIAGLPSQSPPPVCLVVFNQRHADEGLDQAVMRLGRQMLSQVHTSVLALRLFKQGWFLTPDQAEVCFAIKEHVWDLQRTPGPYRQAFLAGDAQMPFPGYELKISELTTSTKQKGAVTVLWEQLNTVRSHASNGSLDIALENFNRSYGFQLKPSQRLAALFIALDAMLGGFHETEPGGVKLSGREGKFTQRFKAAMLAAGEDFIAANQQLGWLNEAGKPGGGRWLRNRIAHGDDVDFTGISGGSQLRLQAIIRTLLRQYISFLAHWHNRRDELCERLALPENCSPVGAYNAALAAYAAEDAGVAALLC